MRHVDRKIVEQRLPGSQHRFLAHFAPGHPARCEGGDLERADARVAETLDLQQRLRIGAKYCPQGPETSQKVFRQWLGVPPGLSAEEQVFEDFVIGERFGTAFEQALAQPGSVAGARMALSGGRLSRRARQANILPLASALP